MFDFLRAFGRGEDTGEYAIGFHAVIADIADGRGPSGMLTGPIPVPEPTVVCLLGLAGIGLVVRRQAAR